MTSYQIRYVILNSLKDKALTLIGIYNLFPKDTLGITIALREMSESGELVSALVDDVVYYTV